ncbi:MAG: hypothetical protein HC927_05010 [Deltaproteobacteria bacterium]|nr:hypothetical protein [Deltaproteobacteria bacterium]
MIEGAIHDIANGAEDSAMAALYLFLEDFGVKATRDPMREVERASSNGNQSDR